MKKKYLGIVAMLATVMLVFMTCGSDSSSADKANGSTKGDKEVSGSLTAVGSTALQPLVEANFPKNLLTPTLKHKSTCKAAVLELV